MSVPLLLISGPVGVGKSTIAAETVGLVAEAGVTVAGVDLDALTQVWPRPVDDRFNNRLALRNLADVWRNGQGLGATHLVVACVIESRADLEGFRAAVPSCEITLVGLRARLETLLARLVVREVGSSRQWHLDRAVELAKQMETAAIDDFVVRTDDRDVREIAREVLRIARWPGADLQQHQRRQGKGRE